MRLLVCGDRNWTDKIAIRREISRIKPDVVIHGGCRGADMIANDIAKNMGIPHQCFRADWVKYGLRAGPIRNTQMIKEGKPDLVIAFHSNIENSKGTKDMVNKAKQHKTPVEVYKE